MPITTQTTQTAPITTAEHTTVPVNESEIIESERISQEISRFEEMIITSESAAVETIQESAAANSDINASTQITAPAVTAVIGSEKTISEISETTIDTTFLSPEETVAQTTVAATETVVIPSAVIPDTKVIVDYQTVGICGAIVALLAILGAIKMKTSKHGVKSVYEYDKSKRTAKERDDERLSAEKAESEGNSKAKKKHKEKKQLNKNAIATMPYKKILSDNIWLIGSNTYSKVYTFDDMNFNLSDEDEQYAYMDRYIEFLNMLDDTVDCQISCWNSRINLDDFRERTLIKEKTIDKYSNLRYEYNSRVLEENIKKGQNAIQKHMYITLTIKAPDEETAARKFKTLDVAMINTFNRIGSANMRALSSQERVEMLKDFFIDTEWEIPKFTDEQFRKSEEKLYCCPSYFEFRKDYFMWDDKYAKVIYIKDYPSTATSDIINDVMKIGLEIMVTINVVTYDMAKAKNKVQSQITAIDTDMGKREMKAAQYGNFSVQIPQCVKNQRDAMVSVYDKITTQDQKLFMSNIQILIKADSYIELKNNTEIVQSALTRNGCMCGAMPWEQEDGMCDCLPVGYQRKFSWLRTMPSESVAIFMPFNVKESRMPNATYYGQNVLSHNLITFDRVSALINPSGYILGCPGSGKSFTAKREMTDVFLRNPNADIMIIDPEREYQGLVGEFGGTVVKFASGSKSYINPFDFDFKMLMENETDSDNDAIDVIYDKCALITSFISCMDKSNPLTAQEKSFIDRCVRKTYYNSGVLDTLDRSDMPTLSDLSRTISEETENVTEEMKTKLLLTIEMYIGDGSASYFDKQTNVDTENRIISYDIRELSDVLKTQAMLLILDYIWNRLSRNRDKGRLTYIYIDEIYLLFADEYCLEYLEKLWKRARKYGGVLTGITQNVEDLLRDDKTRSMLSNSEFIILLKQAAPDAAKLQSILHFTNNELQYVKDTPAGHGILVLGGNGKDKIPFFDEFPVDTELYKKMSTRFIEKTAQ